MHSVDNAGKRTRQELWQTLIFVSFLALANVATPVNAANRVVAWGAGTFIGPPSDPNNLGQSIVPTNLANAAFVAGGGHFSLALNSGGTLTGWGDDANGQMDYFPYATNYIAFAGGWQQSLALHWDGTVTSAGILFSYQTDVPSNLSNVVAIGAGYYHSLGLRADGSVVAWGLHTNDAQIGIDPNYGQTRVPANLSNVVAIAGGGWHSLALKADGTVRGWGRDDYGQADTAGLSNVVAIAAGAVHSVALKGDGTAVAWGANDYGQTNVPAGLSNVIAIAAGGWHNLALMRDGKVVAWGAGSGSHPNVDFGQNIVPAGLSNVVQISAGALHSLALVGDGPPITSASLLQPRYGTNGFSASLPTHYGRVYRLEYKNSLNTNPWIALPLTPGLGGITTMNDSSSAATQRFYRARQW